MPTYEFHCHSCGEAFERVQTVSERDERSPRCPRCQSDDVEQVMATFFAKTSRKS